MTHKAIIKPSHVIHGDYDQPTCIHFGIDMAPHPDQTIVMIQQNSQYVIVEQHTWPDMKDTIDEYYQSLEQQKMLLVQSTNEAQLA